MKVSELFNEFLLILNSKMILKMDNGSMNDITLEWRYNSVKIWCRIIRKYEDKNNDDEYECDDKRDK